MPYDYSKLRGKIVEKFGYNKLFANAMGLSERSLSLKINGRRYWDQREIEKAIKLLGVSEEEISDYFFVKNVQQN